MLKSVAVFAAACVVSMLPVSLSADVTLGASNNPLVNMDDRLSALFRAESSTARQFDRNKIDRLVGPAPKKSPDGWDRIDRRPTATGGKEWACLREALYFEARGETVSGIFAVAEVILNRVEDRRYPSSICGVVNQGTGQKFRCQFTYTCDGIPETMNNERAKQRLGKVARIMIDGHTRNLTGGATHYHTKAVNPKWARVFPRTTTIGYHHFYKQPDRLASR